MNRSGEMHGVSMGVGGGSYVGRKAGGMDPQVNMFQEFHVCTHGDNPEQTDTTENITFPHLSCGW